MAGTRNRRIPFLFSNTRERHSYSYNHKAPEIIGIFLSKNTKRLVLVFLFALAANFLWENLHAPLYMHYKGGEITEWILLRAAFFDAAFITVLGFLFFSFEFLRKRLWLAFAIGVVFAIGLEWWALETGRWAYTPAMPIIPFIGTGLTPTIQLGLIAYLIFKKFKLSTV